MKLAYCAALLLTTMSASAAVKIDKVSYDGWPNCYRLSNGEVELIVTTDVGPRVMRYAFVGGRNVFAEFKDELGKSGEKKWMPRGGHRLWMGPEDAVLSYALDNSPITAKVGTDTITLTQAVEPETGLQKEIVVRLAATGSAVEVTHHLKNVKGSTREIAPWALTMMAPGGVGITGFPPRGTHPKDLQPTNPLVIWPYTDLSDPRWVYTKKYLILKSDPKATSPQKIGSFNPNNWAAYLLGSDLFVKQTKADPAKRYPDMGSSFETFTNATFQELETLGPLVRLQPGETATHVEHWSLHKDVKIPHWTDDTLDSVVLPLLSK